MLFILFFSVASNAPSYLFLNCRPNNIPSLQATFVSLDGIFKPFGKAKKEETNPVRTNVNIMPWVRGSSPSDYSNQ